MPEKSDPRNGRPEKSSHFKNICVMTGLLWLVAMCVYRHDKLIVAFGAIPAIPRIMAECTALHLMEFGKNILLLACFFGAAVCIGRLLFRCLRPDGFGAQEELLLSLGLGLGAFSLCSLALGMLGIFAPIQLRLIFGLTTLACLPFNLRRVPQKPSFRRDDTLSSPSYLLIAAASSMLLGLIAINFIGAMGPEVFYDALVYHLALPELYLLNHRIIPTPYNIYSGIPFNTEMLYALALALGGEGLAKLIPWGLSLGTLYLIFLWAKKHMPAEMALFSALLFYSCPMVASQTWHCLVEIHWGFFALLAIYCLLRIKPSGPSDFRKLTLVGLFSGICLGTKYNAFSLPLVLLVLLSCQARTSPGFSWKKMLKENIFLLSILSMTASPWLLKNIYFYNNPLFPFFNELFPGAPQGIAWQNLIIDAKGRDLKAAFTTLSGSFDLFGTLWAKEWGGIDSLGLGLLMFLPCAFFPKRSTHPCRNLWIALILCWTIWATTSRMPRFFIFALPFLAILSMNTLLDFLGSGKTTRNAFRLLLLIACAISSCEIFQNWAMLGGWKVAFGLMDKTEYLSHSQPMYPTPYYAAMAYINRNLPEHAKVLFIAEARGYYAERNFIATSPFARNPIADMLAASRTPEELRDALLRAGITHIFVNRQEINRQGNIPPFPKEKEPLFMAFATRHLFKIFEKRTKDDMQDLQWVQVYKITG